jgi:predicted TIM-barrel enzyme
MEKRSFFNQLFGHKPLIAVLHLFCVDSPKDRIKKAVDECRVLLSLGFKYFIVENYDFDSEDISFQLSEVVATLKREFGDSIVLGVKTKSDRHVPTLAHESNGASFIQFERITGAIKRGNGSDELVDYEHEDVFCRERRKHPSVFVLGGLHPDCYLLKDPEVSTINGSYENPHPLLISSCLQASELCNAVVLTGGAVKFEIPESRLRGVRTALGNFPLVIGSGLSDANARTLLPFADAAIVGSYIREEGVGSRISRARVEKLFNIRELVCEQHPLVK